MATYSGQTAYLPHAAAVDLDNAKVACLWVNHAVVEHAKLLVAVVAVRCVSRAQREAAEGGALVVHRWRRAVDAGLLWTASVMIALVGRVGGLVALVAERALVPPKHRVRLEVRRRPLRAVRRAQQRRVLAAVLVVVLIVDGPLYFPPNPFFNYALRVTHGTYTNTASSRPRRRPCRAKAPRAHERAGKRGHLTWQ